VRYKAIAPSWDNTPRKESRGSFAYGCNSTLFKRALASTALKTVADSKLRGSGFLFVNAWNEWGEGAHLEPDLRYGYGWLEAIANVMDKKMEDL
jgi:hypothetical protein